MRTSLIVYLAGPMTGQTLEETMGWRKKATGALRDAGFTVLDPTKGLAFLKPESRVEDSYDDTAATNKHTIFLRDRFDATRADMLLVNLTGADTVSIGTMMELAWSNLAGRFPVVVMEPEGNPHKHAFVSECAGVVFENVDEAVDYIIRTFEV